MDPAPSSFAFYDALPRQESFDAMSDPDRYTPLPDDWVVGTADIVSSTRAIADGKYKTVNMVGAAVITAQFNQLGGRAFPFVFGGDGAAFALPPELAARSAEALAAVRRWALDSFGLDLRAAQVPVSEIRAAGRDVRVARYQVSREVDYAMFSGGGINWAEAQMKAGAHAIAPAPAGTQPNLDGLSCRWSHMKSRNGSVLSVVIEPVGDVPGPDFVKVADRIIGIAQTLERAGHPVPPQGAGVRWPPTGIGLEALARRGASPSALRRLFLLGETLLAWVLLRTGMPLAGFRPRHYRSMVARNADYRKFDDGLKMTLDCDPATEAKLRAVLEEARAAGVIRYGIVAQDRAMMTCIVPSAMDDTHMHFIDGAEGGYARAAAQIKAAA